MATFKFNKDTKQIEKKQDEHPAYVTLITQAIKAFQNGKHRRTSPQAHSNPSHGAGAGAGAYGTSPAFATLLLPNPPTLADYAQLFATGFPEPLEPTPPTIPFAGIRTGEVIGERLWWIKRHGLTSLSTDFVWQFGATITGATNKKVQRWINSVWNEWHVLYGGVYSFFPVCPQISFEQERMKDLLYRCGGEALWIGFARGTIKMWGNVIEHERGYRAQFAKLLHIDHWYPNPHDPQCHDWCEAIVNAHNEAAKCKT